MKSHQGIKHSCLFSDCEKIFSRPDALQEHVKSAHQGVRRICQFDDCRRVYTSISSLNDHIKSAHKGVRYNCEFEDCTRVFTKSFARRRHVLRDHQGIRFRCRWDECEKHFSTKSYMEEHIKSAHLGEVWLCPFNNCEKVFSSSSGLSLHISTIHFGTRYPCGFCEKIYSAQRDQVHHFKTCHGTPQDATEMREKKLKLRKFLAEKEAQGICSATKSCENAVVQDSFCCDYHQKTVDSVAKAIQEKSEAGRLLSSSVQTPDEFQLLLQRQMIYLDPQVKATLHLLAQGFDDEEIAAKSFSMDTEFVWIGQYTALDITIDRLHDGKEILSTRVDHQMDIEELQQLCSTNPISTRNVLKVYGKSDKT